MEKAAAKSKNHGILKHLTKALSFQNRPFSPRRDNWTEINANRTRNHGNRGFAGPIVQMIPAEARRKSKKFVAEEEPTSPKVSCIGQIKCKKMMAKNREASPRKNIKTKKNTTSMMERLFGGGGERPRAPPVPDLPSAAAVVPDLSQMRKFASSRESLSKFDWVEEERHVWSDDERAYSDGEDDVIIPFSAPILGRVATEFESEPRKEINLWKRRTTAQPKPLLLNM